MKIEELKLGGEGEAEEKEKPCEGGDGREVGVWDAKRILVGAGARALFYPTLLYNVLRNKLQPGFRWWDRISQFILLGAVPFPSDVPHLKALGVKGVITLNDPYETLVPTSLYHDFGIDHLLIPTRDYYFASSHMPCCGLHSCYIFCSHEENELHGQTTYVHCKAGRGRSTTIVLCYLVLHKHMTPDAAYNYVKSICPRVLLASAQWQAVLDYYHFNVKSNVAQTKMTDWILRAPRLAPSQNLVMLDDGSLVVVTKADLDGYDASLDSVSVRNQIWAH